MREDIARLQRRIKSGEKEAAELARKAEEAGGRVAGLQEQLEALEDAQVGWAACAALVLGAPGPAAPTCTRRLLPCGAQPWPQHAAWQAACLPPSSPVRSALSPRRHLSIIPTAESAGEGPEEGAEGAAAAGARAGGGVQPHQAGGCCGRFRPGRPRAACFQASRRRSRAHVRSPTDHAPRLRVPPLLAPAGRARPHRPDGRRPGFQAGGGGGAGAGACRGGGRAPFGAHAALLLAFTLPPLFAFSRLADALPSASATHPHPQARDMAREKAERIDARVEELSECSYTPSRL